MDPCLIIHIGTHKTGSTALQSGLSRLRQDLDRAGVIYPDFGMEAHHGLVAKSNGLNIKGPVANDPYRAWESMARAAARSGKKFILSSEEFSRVSPNRPDFVSILDIVERHVPARLICFVREPLGFLQSAYVELSKARTPPPPEVVVDEAIINGTFTGVAVDYNVLLDTLEQQMPLGKVEFYSYEKATSSADGILSFFLNEVLPELSAEGLKALPSSENKSEPALAVWAANLVCSPRVPTTGDIHLVADAIAKRVPDLRRASLFNIDEIERLHFRFAPATKRFAQRIGKPDDFAAPPSIESFFGKPSRRQLDAMVWTDIARAFYARAA